MANAVKDAVMEKSKLFDQLNENSEKRGFNPLLLTGIPVVLVITTIAFFIMRRMRNTTEKY